MGFSWKFFQPKCFTSDPQCPYQISSKSVDGPILYGSPDNLFGFEEEVYEVDDPLFNMEKNKMKEFIKETDFFGNKTPIQGWKETAQSKYFLSGAKTANPKVEQIVDKVKPDLVVLDCTFILPSLIKNYPWISLITPNINSILFDERSPPPGLGALIIIIIHAIILI